MSSVKYKFLVLTTFFILSFILITSFVFCSKNGKIISQEKFVPHIYETLDPEFRQKISKEIYDYHAILLNKITDVDFFKITYLSDGLKIVGFLVQPKNITKKLPVIIYNRGGCKESGKLEALYIYNELYYLAQAGYIVLASQYRGNDGSEGSDECGGSDIQDILSLFETAKTLPNADTQNIFMIGFSRGGIMTYQALKNNVPINAAVVIAGISDVPLFCKMRPDAEKNVLDKVIPATDNKNLEYQNRSGINWINKINKPILLIHNSDDYVVSVEHSKKIAKLLEDAKKPHELIIFDDNKHVLHKYRDQAHAKILEWLNKYKK